MQPRHKTTVITALLALIIAFQPCALLQASATLPSATAGADTKGLVLAGLIGGSVGLASYGLVHLFSPSSATLSGAGLAIAGGAAGILCGALAGAALSLITVPLYAAFGSGESPFAPVSAAVLSCAFLGAALGGHWAGSRGDALSATPQSSGAAGALATP